MTADTSGEGSPTTPPARLPERAAFILEQFFAPDPDLSVGRRNSLLDLGGSSGADLRERRLWAEAWQALERAGLICQDPPPDESHFLTATGRAALDDPVGALDLAGIR